MTTYVTIPNTDIDQDSPITQPLMTALRDNPIAIAEADSSVAVGLLPTVSLGTISTASGSSVSLTSLDLTPYRGLRFFFNGVSASANSVTFRIDGQNLWTTPNLSYAYNGVLEMDLGTGVCGGAVGHGGTTDVHPIAADTSYSTATTTVTFTVSTGAFDAGAIYVYGVK